MNAFPRIILILFVFVLASCATITQDSDTVPPLSQAYLRDLSYGYALLADYENYVSGNTRAGSRFAQKSEQAAQGRAVDPEPVAKNDYAQAELKQARAIALDVRNFGQNANNARAAAEVQLNYECWNVRARTRLASAAYCQQRFYETLDHLILPRQNFSVIFASSKDVPDKAGLQTIRDAASTVIDSPYWQVHLTSHIDQARSTEEAIFIALRRSVAIRNALIQNGVNRDHIVLETIKGGAQNPSRIDIRIFPTYRIPKEQMIAVQPYAQKYLGEGNVN